ncbi:hypothetical protein EV401DRAFT_152730 [Pisolithus croceorrhizus]|nr:hypothetical protein EV401DRAFT_152730 [Pisolithus croceorrhizus]
MSNANILPRRYSGVLRLSAPASKKGGSLSILYRRQVLHSGNLVAVITVDLRDDEIFSTPLSGAFQHVRASQKSLVSRNRVDHVLTPTAYANVSCPGFLRKTVARTQQSTALIESFPSNRGRHEFTRHPNSPGRLWTQGIQDSARVDAEHDLMYGYTRCPISRAVPRTSVDKVAVPRLHLIPLITHASKFSEIISTSSIMESFVRS